MKKCTVTVACALSEETFGYLCEKIRRKFGEDFNFVRRNDDSLIGGFILEVNGEVYDMSIASQLAGLKKHLKED